MYFERTAEFCELYDSPAFDTDAETLPLSEFEPMQRLMEELDKVLLRKLYFKVA